MGVAVYSVNQVARAFRVRPATIRRWVRRGYLPERRLNGWEYCFTEWDIQRLTLLTAW